MNFVVVSSFIFFNYLVVVKGMRTMGQSMDWMQGNDNELMDYMQPNEVGRDRKYDNLEMNDGCLCTRDCCKYSKPRICYYKFFVEQYTAMGPACRNCSAGKTEDCYQHQCVAADGVERMIYCINRKIPAPTIDVCMGDRVIVDVFNGMLGQGVSIHWHGVYQKETPFMDGVPYLTQCPIHANGQFRYNFTAGNSGSMFYHSHLGNGQRDGIQGNLMVRKCKEPNSHLYDHHYPSHYINIYDWFHFPSDTFFPGYYKAPQSYVSAKPVNILINGMGSFKDNTTQTNTPHAKFYVKCGCRYAMDVIAAITSTCPILFTIEEHTLLIINTDNTPVEPVEVNTLYMGSAMRARYVLKTKSKSECKYSYNIVVQSVGGCTNSTKPQTAQLIYEDCKSQPTDPPPPNYATVFRPPFLDRIDYGCHNNKSNPPNICSSQLRSLSDLDPRLSCGEPDFNFFLAPGSYQYSYKDQYENDMAPYQFAYFPAGGPSSNRPPTFNGIFIDTLMKNISCMMPPCPLLTEKCKMPENMTCNGECDKEVCQCVNIVKVTTNSIVQFVINNNYSNQANHPIHLHGHDFVILEQGSPQQLKERDYYQKSYCKTRRPVLRDVVMTPIGGYVVLRFRANNPGYWMVHCHFQNHMDGGMFFIIKVGKRSEFVPPPKGFPKCSPFLVDIDGLSKYSGSAKCGNKYMSNMTTCSPQPVKPYGKPYWYQMQNTV